MLTCNSFYLCALGKSPKSLNTWILLMQPNEGREYNRKIGKITDSTRFNSLVGKLNTLLDGRLEFWLQCFQPFFLKVWEWPQIKNLLHTVLPQPHLNQLITKTITSILSSHETPRVWMIDAKFWGLPLRQRKEAQWWWTARMSIPQHLELRWVLSSMHQRIVLQHSCDKD